MKIISIVNPKGGAGKTVSAINIAYALKNKGKKDTVLNLMMKTANVVYGKNFLLEKLGEKKEKFLLDYLRLQKTKIDLSDYFSEGINDTYKIF